MWEILQDPDVLAKALPGTKTLTKVGDDRYQGVMKVSVGPMSAAEFAISVELKDKVEPETFAMLIDGKGGVGFTKGTATIAPRGTARAGHRDDLHIGRADWRQDRRCRTAPARVGRQDDDETGARGVEQGIEGTFAAPSARSLDDDETGAPFEYFRPQSLDEALSLLAEHGGDAKPLAGGQSLIPAMNFRLATPSVLVDLNSLRRAQLYKATIRAM